NTWQSIVTDLQGQERNFLKFSFGISSVCTQNRHNKGLWIAMLLPAVVVAASTKCRDEIDTCMNDYSESEGCKALNRLEDCVLATSVDCIYYKEDQDLYQAVRGAVLYKLNDWSCTIVSYVSGSQRPATVSWLVGSMVGVTWICLFLCGE
ncbi:hypothetical protein EGW08_021441, partial [Elysia chlorotica]